MTGRVALGAVVLASVGPGLLFAPVFGIGALAVPLLLVALVGYGVAELAMHRSGLVPWRALLGLVAGQLVLTEALLWRTTVGGLPTGGSVRALAHGVTESWQRTLQSTWPARPDPELVLFVPLAALVATVLAVELLSRLRWPLVALLPGLAVLGLSQAYVALTDLAALVAAFCFAALAAALLTATRHDTVPTRSAGSDSPAVRTVVAVVLVVPTLVLSAAGAVLAAATDPVDRPAYSLRDEHPAPLPSARVTSPLDDVADRLLDPRRPVFTYSTDAPVDRWRLAVLNAFDGANWTFGGDTRSMGAMLAVAPGVTTDIEPRGATVELPGDATMWVPSQPMPAEVSGLAPLVDEDSGMLVAPDRYGPVSYDLRWWEPQIPYEELYGAAIDPTADGGFAGLGAIPPGISELADEAVGGMRPSFQTALALEQFLRKRCQVAEGTDLPTGNGWPQLSTFLLRTKRGTSEQFAAAYVALARIRGIPARVVVGFRAPEGAGTDVVVRNEDVLAWPEVAVAGVGWVPLDPTVAADGTDSGGAAATGGLAEATARAREALPPADRIKPPELPSDDRADEADDAGAGFSVPWLPLVIAVAAVGFAWLVGVPLTTAIRRWRRRRRQGAGAVVGAWHEARDRLRAYGTPFTTGMTVRDLAGVVPDPPVAEGLHALARNVDTALWSPTGPTPSTVDESWSAVRAIRRALRTRPLPARLRAMLNVRTLFPPG